MSFMILKTFRGDSLSVAPLSHRTELRSKKVVSLSVLKCRSINCFLNWMTYSDSIKPVQNLISRKWNLGFFHSVLFFPPCPQATVHSESNAQKRKKKIALQQGYPHGQACAVCAVCIHALHADVAQSRGTMSRFLVLCGAHNTAWQLDTSGKSIWRWAADRVKLMQYTR